MRNRACRQLVSTNPVDTKRVDINLETPRQGALRTPFTSPQRLSLFSWWNRCGTGDFNKYYVLISIALMFKTYGAVIKCFGSSICKINTHCMFSVDQVVGVLSFLRFGHSCYSLWCLSLIFVSLKVVLFGVVQLGKPLMRSN